MSQRQRSPNKQHQRSANCQFLRSPPAVPPLTWFQTKLVVFKKTIDPNGPDMQTMINSLRANVASIMATLSWGPSFGNFSEYGYDFDTYPTFSIGNGDYGNSKLYGPWGVNGDFYRLNTFNSSGFTCYGNQDGVPVGDGYDSNNNLIVPQPCWCWIQWIRIFQAPLSPANGLPLDLTNPWRPIPASVYIARDGLEPNPFGGDSKDVPSASLMSDFFIQHGPIGSFTPYSIPTEWLAQVATGTPPPDVDGPVTDGSVYFQCPITDKLGPFTMTFYSFPGPNVTYQRFIESYIFSPNFPRSGISGAGGDNGAGAGDSSDGAGG